MKIKCELCNHTDYPKFETTDQEYNSASCVKCGGLFPYQFDVAEINMVESLIQEEIFEECIAARQPAEIFG